MKTNEDLEEELRKTLIELEKAKEKLKYRRGRTLELYARKTYLVRKEYVERLEDIAYFSQRSLKDTVEEGIEYLINKYCDYPSKPDYLKNFKKYKK